MQASPDISVRIERRSRILDRAEARLVALAGARFPDPIEERHGTVFRQALHVSREGWLRRVPRNNRLVELVLGFLLRLLRVFGLVDVLLAPRLTRDILQVHATAVAGVSAGRVLLYLHFRYSGKGWHRRNWC